jgi:hypothetical protein
MSDQSSEFLAKAAAEPVRLSIHDLLAIWSFRYRDFDSVGRIQRDLAASGLACEPSFAEGSMREMVTVGVVPASEAPSGDRSGEEAPCAPADDGMPQAAEDDDELALPQVAWLVSDVPSAVAGIKYVHPSATLEQAQQIMMESGFSQLAVMTGPTELKGAVSWEGIAKARIANARVNLGDAIDRFPKMVYADQELLEQLDAIFAAGFVFVRDHNDFISGIITNADLTSQFGDLTTPFFQLGEIERRIRQCIGAVFSVDELRQVTRKPTLTSVNDMMFGQYQRLLEDRDRWQRLHWMLDREMFIEHLDDVRKVRNHIMHFGARPLDDAQKNRLAKFLYVMRYLNPMP